MNSLSKMVDWLYSKGDNVSDFQKCLRFIMFARSIRERVEESNRNYKLNKKEWSLLETVTGKKYE